MLRQLWAVLGFGAASLAWTAASGCADETAQPGGPLVPVEDAGLDAETDGGAGGAASRRTVETRNPFGNVAKYNNLLWDGDFEWFYRWADQYSWFAGSGSYLSGYLDDVVIGAQCRSGVKCAELRAGGLLLGVGVSSRGHSLAVAFSARPSSGDCAGVEAALLTESYSEPEVALTPASDAPDASGWCRYSAVASERQSAAMLFIANVSDESALIDDAVIEPVEPRAMHYSGRPPSPERRRDLASLREQVREARKPWDPPPNPERLLFERKMKRLRPRRATRR